MSVLKSLKSQISCYLNLPILYGKFSYSQEGEDIILDKIFEGKKDGFYVDIGAFHPFKYSNTQKLYEKGWNGINIEPNKGNCKLFNIARKRDINLNIGIGSKNATQTYYTFEDPALNTFDHYNYEAVINSGQSRFLRSYKQEIKDPNYIINIYLKNKVVDFLNIDAEGFSYLIVESFLKKGIQPEVICLEREDMGKGLNMNNIIIRIMSKYLYHITAVTNMSYVFTRSAISRR